MNFLYFVTMFIGMASPVLAQEGGKPAPGGFGFGSFLPMMLVMFLIIYFLMIRPEQKKQKEKRTMLQNVKKGDKVLTVGGIYGTVSNVKDDTIMLRIGDNTTVKFSKSAISSVITKDDETKTSEDKKK